MYKFGEGTKASTKEVRAHLRAVLERDCATIIMQHHRPCGIVVPIAGRRFWDKYRRSDATENARKLFAKALAELAE